MRTPLATLLSLCAAFALTGFAAGAEPLPLPRVDFFAEARVRGLEGPVLLRHHAGLFRIDGRHQGAEMTLFIDSHEGRATLVSDLGGRKVALPLAGAEPAVFRGETVTGRRIGRDRVAGQPCELWAVEEATSGRNGIACVSADGITLELRPQKGAGADFQIVRLDRRSQDPALFRLP